MGLKSAIFEMKDAIVKQQTGRTEEEFVHELEQKHSLIPGTLVSYYNNLMLISIHNKQNSRHSFDPSKKINRKWSKVEVEFMFQYIEERQNEGGLNITGILDEIAQLLNRGYQSVNYKYYSKIKEYEQKQPINQKYNFITIQEDEVPVISTEVIRDNPVNAHMQQQDNPIQDDLLDILSGLISNVQQLPGINLNELLKSLYQLTNMALMNQSAARQIETIKSEVHLEKEALHEKLLRKDQQLQAEKKRNDQLQLEVSKLAKEIAAFNKLGDAAKIQNLKSYTQRLNYMIDGFGVVLQVGS